jgi:hypothetical protein
MLGNGPLGWGAQRMSWGLARIIHERPKVPIFGTQVTVAPAARVVRAWR